MRQLSRATTVGTRRSPARDGKARGFAPWRLRALFGDPIPAEAVGRFFDQLAALVAAGTGLPEALRDAARAADPEIRAICARVAGLVSAGMPLHRALAPWASRFPPIVLPVLEVGHLSGTLENAARRLAGTFSGSAAIERKFRWSIFDWRLAALLVALQSVSAGLRFSAADAALAALRVLAELVALYLAARLACRVLMRWQPLRLFADTVKLAIPHVGQAARMFAAARWGRSFATLWHAGVPVSEALEVSARSAVNAHYERALVNAAAETRAGRTLRESLSGVQLLPAPLVEVLGAAEEAGTPGEALDRFVPALEAEALTMATQDFVVAVVAIKVLVCIAMAATVLR